MESERVRPNFFFHFCLSSACKSKMGLPEILAVTIVCRAFGFPPLVVQWSKAFSLLPQGRSAVVNGTLTISRFSLQDAGSYQCKATNGLGSVTTQILLQIQTGKRQTY